MTEFDLNLSTQPFPAYRLANLGLIAVLIALALVSVVQALGFIQYSDLARSTRSAEQESRVVAESLGKRMAELETRLDRPESAAKLNEIGFLNHIILQRTLAWTKLFRVLEEMVPENVHFTNLTPEVGQKGEVTLRLGVRARSIADMTKFIERVEQSPLFENVMVTVEEKKDSAVATDVDVTLSTIYFPQRDTQ
jgi:Tfp pilus assembly protein PilN